MCLKKLFFNCSIILLFLCALTACGTSSQDSGLKTIRVSDKKVKIEIVDTQELMAKGLSDRPSLPPEQGMLFVFDDYSRPSFWMKNMQFPIDIIWIKDDTIADITKNTPSPDGSAYLPTYSPKENVNYVLEVNAGWCDKNKIEIGDIVKL